MGEGKDVRWSMVVNRLIADWMTFVNAYNRQESRLRTIQVIISPFGRTEKVFYSEEPMLHDAYDTWYKSYFGKMQEVGKTFNFNVKNESNLLITVDMSSINELMKVKLGDHVYESARELYGNEFDTLKQYVLEYKTHKISWEDVTPEEWSEIEKELRNAHKQLSVDLSNRLSEYTKVVSEIMNLCDGAYEDCARFMRKAYREYYKEIEKLGLELEELAGESITLDVFGEKIVMNDFDAIYDRYVKHEMHLDELATARRTLVGIVERYRGDGYDE